MAEREKGVEQIECPNCGSQLNPVEQPDGATAYETCSNCYPSEAPEPAPEPEKAQRRTRRETGTEVAPASSGEEGN